jgi:hypothetical protein
LSNTRLPSENTVSFSSASNGQQPLAFHPPLKDTTQTFVASDNPFTQQESELSKSSEAVPEPSTVLGGLALGTWWGAVSLKRRKDKKS